MKKLFSVLILGVVSFSLLASSAIYVGGPIYKPGALNNVNILKKSGFTEVIVWSVAILPKGDLNLNHEFLIVSGGKYVGDAKYSDFAKNMKAIKQKTSSVKRLTFSIGSSNVGDFQKIVALVNSQGTGKDSILYKNFKALKDATGADAIDLDNENCFGNDDAAALSKFVVMLGGLGYKVSFCTFNNLAFWTKLSTLVNKQKTGIVDSIKLQCYAGGGFNSPQGWNINGIPVQPGLWPLNDKMSADIIKQILLSWKKSFPYVNGGFIWLYDDFVKQGKTDLVSGYAKAINALNKEGSI